MSNSLESSEFGANPVVYCGNYSLFEKQLLVYYWALVEAECQPWATKIPGSCNVHLYRADKVIKLGVQSHSPSSNPSSAYRIRLEQALKPQVSCMKKWPNCPRSPLLLYWLLFPRLYVRLDRAFLKISSQRKREDSGLVYRWFCMLCSQNPKVGSWGHYSSFLGHP